MHRESVIYYMTLKFRSFEVVAAPMAVSSIIWQRPEASRRADSLFRVVMAPAVKGVAAVHEVAMKQSSRIAGAPFAHLAMTIDQNRTTNCSANRCAIFRAASSSCCMLYWNFNSVCGVKR